MFKRLRAHRVGTAYKRGWSRVTTQELFFQPHSLAILVLTTTSWPRIKAAADQMAAVVTGIRPGEVCELRIP